MMDLRERIDAFLIETGLAKSRFGRDVMNNSSFVDELRGGRDYTSRTETKCDQFMADYRAKQAAASVTKGTSDAAA